MLLLHRYTQSAPVAVASISTGTPLALPNSLLIPPGLYSWRGKMWPMHQAGLYKGLAAPSATDREVMCRVVTGTAMDMLTAASWATVHGEHPDEQLTVAQRSDKARTGSLVMRCGHICNWTKYLLSQIGVESRIVSVVAMPPYNNYDDGHVCLEVKIGAEWVLADVTSDRLFKDTITSKFVSARHISDKLKSTTTVDAPLTSSRVNFAVINDSVNSAYAQAVLDKWNGPRVWTQRVFAAVGMAKTGQYHFKMPTGATAAQVSALLAISPTYRVVTPAQFDAMFYT
jgi:hypothetical protein